MNGVIGVFAYTTECEPCFVPHSEEAGVEVLGSSFANWETGFACVLDQSEMLLRFDDLFWVETKGDLDQQTVAVGRYKDAGAGIAAAAKASFYFSIDADGDLVCELDNWSQDE